MRPGGWVPDADLAAWLLPRADPDAEPADPEPEPEPPSPGLMRRAALAVTGRAHERWRQRWESSR